jgi:hypothetical protein
VYTTTYHLAGLRIVSDLPLPGLPPCDDESLLGDGISIRRGRIPESLSRVTAAFPHGQCNENELLLDISNVARYLLRNGNEILVDQAVASNHSDVCAYLLGTVFGLLCHQRGITPLHALAIDVAGGCVAFAGASGAGKSTLGAALAARGHPVVADDVCFLQLGGNGGVRAWPNVQHRIRVWEDAIAALGCQVPGLEPVWCGWNKYFIPVSAPRNPMEPRCLRRVYHLQAGSDGGAISIKQLHGAAAIEVLMQNVYRLDIAKHMGLKPAAFVVCAAAAREVPVFRLSRPLDFNVLREGIDLLEDDLRDLR